MKKKKNSLKQNDLPDTKLYKKCGAEGMKTFAFWHPKG